MVATSETDGAIYESGEYLPVYSVDHPLSRLT